MPKSAAGLVRVVDVSVHPGATRKSISLVNDVRPVRKFVASWANWTDENQQPKSAFNWTAVYNFKASTDALLFSLGSENLSDAMMLVRIGHVVQMNTTNYIWSWTGREFKRYSLTKELDEKSNQAATDTS